MANDFQDAILVTTEISLTKIRHAAEICSKHVH